MDFNYDRGDKMKYYSINEALELLDEHEISISRPAVQKWVTKKLIASEKKNNKHFISEEELFLFISRKRPKMVELIDRVNKVFTFLETLSEKIDRLERKIVQASEIESEILHSIKTTEDKINGIEKIIIDVKFFNGVRDNQNKMLHPNENKEFENDQLPLAVDDETECNLPFPDSEIKSAMESQLTSDQFLNMGDRIFKTVKLDLCKRYEIWNKGDDGHKYTCPYSGKQFKSNVPFLKLIIKYIVLKITSEKEENE